MAYTKNTLGLRNRHFFALDILAIGIAAAFSFLMRLDLNVTARDWQGLLLFLLLAIPIQLTTFVVCGMYVRYWLDPGANDLLLVAFACIVSGLLTLVTTVIARIGIPVFASLVPRSIPLIDNPMLTMFVIMLRFSQRAYWQQFHVRRRPSDQTADSRVLIVGAGDTGILVLNSLRQTSPEITVVGFLDDDPNKVAKLVHGARVIARIGALKNAVAQYRVNLVIIAVPSAPGSTIRKIATDCRQMGVKHKTMPGLTELINGSITINALRPVSIDDLLRRPSVELDVTDIQHQVRDRCVLITGAGGSIGSELARQVAQFQPRYLLLLGHGENSLFTIENRLKKEFPSVELRLLLVDVRDVKRIRQIFAEWRPNIVLHAAAHKHVPMLETNVVEAVINNVIGTANLIHMCDHYEVPRMVMVSTDKAVAPTNVMGMTKRVAELLMMQAAANRPGHFAVVRFGNVLGSRGSVVPTFQQQIAAGGPVTVTSDKVTRFFMSIPEASRLVLKASVLMAEFGPLFVLNMGKPIHVIDLAHDLIRLSGLEPGIDIEVKITELRPGEKLYEELFWSYESRQAIEQGTLFRVQLSAETLSMIAQLQRQIELLILAARGYDVQTAAKLLRVIVFTAPSALNMPSSVQETRPSEAGPAFV